MPVTLAELTNRLRTFAAGTLSLAALQASFQPVFDADPLDVTLSDATPWEQAPEDARLYWRLLHLFDGAAEAEEEHVRALAGNLVRAVEDAGSATTLELLPLLLDQRRFCTIVQRHAAGVISRTGFLSVIAESGYPPHVKLWLEHAGGAALAALCDRLGSGEYADVAAMVERAP